MTAKRALVRTMVAMVLELAGCEREGEDDVDEDAETSGGESESDDGEGEDAGWRLRRTDEEQPGNEMPTSP